MCRVHLCNRKAVPNSNLCDGHYRQLVDRALHTPALCTECRVFEAVNKGYCQQCLDRVRRSFSESEARVMGREPMTGSRDPIRVYMETERRQHRMRIAQRIAGWTLAFIAAVVLWVLGWLVLSWAIVTFS